MTELPLRWYTPEQVGELLQVSPKSVRRLLDSGGLRGIRVGKLWRISSTALAEFANKPAVSQRTQPPAARESARRQPQRPAPQRAESAADDWITRQLARKV